MSDTKRELIIQKLNAALAEILAANGYNTNMGNNVNRVERKFSPDDCPACTYFPEDETAIYAGGYNLNQMSVRVEGAAVFGAVNPSVVSEQILGDLIEGLTGEMWYLAFENGSTEILPGQTLEQAATGSQAYVESVDVTGGTWGGGDAEGTVTLKRLEGSFAAGDLEVSSSKVAETDGSITWQSAAERVTDGLADDIYYTNGGPGEYPDAGDIVVGAFVMIDIHYKTLAGNPYA